MSFSFSTKIKLNKSQNGLSLPHLQGDPSHNSWAVSVLSWPVTNDGRHATWAPGLWHPWRHSHSGCWGWQGGIVRRLQLPAVPGSSAEEGDEWWEKGKEEGNKRGQGKGDKRGKEGINGTMRWEEMNGKGYGKGKKNNQDKKDQGMKRQGKMKAMSKWWVRNWKKYGMKIEYLVFRAPTVMFLFDFADNECSLNCKNKNLYQNMVHIM